MNLPGNEMKKQYASSKTKVCKALVSFLILVLTMLSYHTASAQQQEMMIRISEIEIDSAYLQDYKAILKEEAAASVKLEPGVIAIFPMYQKENPTQVRILEMYADKTSYQQHLKTRHFLKYKTTTLKMVKSLRLVDMEAIDVATMTLIFRKLKE
ncbi:MAG: Antibiotic biosynthesis monooxygenase [Segetibacter sp.]|nr:Antibiotic biosynthesis monooxygenase [Segetibacter sp.]